MNRPSPGQADVTEPPRQFDARRVGRFLLYIAIVTFCLAAFASIGVILFGEFGGTEGRILLSSFSIAAYSLAGLIATARFGRRPEFLAPVGLACAALGLVLTLALIWSETDSDWFWRTTLSVMIMTGATAHANLLLGSQERRDPATLVLKATLAVNALLTAMIVVPILSDSEPDDGYWKIVAVLAVLLVLGTLVVPIVRKISDSGPPISVARSPFSPGAQDGRLELSYRGRVFVVAADSPAEELVGIRVQAWALDGQEERPILLAAESSTASDPYVALGNAVQAITRAVDDDQL
jgi:hypothetical protein